MFVPDASKAANVISVRLTLAILISTKLVGSVIAVVTGPPSHTTSAFVQPLKSKVPMVEPTVDGSAP